MEQRPIVLRVRDGELVEETSWVYLWLRPSAGRRVIYVGGTGLPPAARAWLHLHDKDPEVARVASHYPAAGGDLREELEMHAFPVPNGVPRRAVRDAVIARLAAGGELSPLYFGFRPVLADETDDVATAADAIVAGLAAILRRSV